MAGKAKSGGKKVASKKAATKKATTKKATTKKAATKKAATKKAAVKKAATKKVASKKAATKKAATKKVASKKAATKKAAVKKAAAKKAATKVVSKAKVASNKATSTAQKAASKADAKKAAVKKVAMKSASQAKTASKAKTATKASPKKAAEADKPALPKMPLHKGVAVARITPKEPGITDQKLTHERDSLTALIGPAQPETGVLTEGSGFMGIPPYQPAEGEAYMGEAQREHFKQILTVWKTALMQEVDRTVHHMQDEAANFPDPNDRATQEEEFSLELRTRDRERKLIKKIEEAMTSLEEDEYGYCDMCGIEIGIRRLEARPTATLCIDCKTMDEIRERQGN